MFSKTTMFLKEGQLTVLGDPCEALSFFLFDDLLLATKPKGKKHKKKLMYAFGLDRMLVKDIVKLDESGTLLFRHIRKLFYITYVYNYIIIKISKLYNNAQ